MIQNNCHFVNSYRFIMIPAIIILTSLLAAPQTAAQSGMVAATREAAASRPPASRRASESVPVDEVSVLVTAGEETTLSAQMQGKIQKVNVGLGESVTAGAVLVEFDCAEQQAQLRAAEADYRAGRETHMTKLKLQALGAAGELEVTVAAAEADKKKSAVDLAESKIEYCRVTAPFSGKVVRLRVKASESVPQGNPLVELVNAANLKSQMFVPSGYLRNLALGTVFQVRIDGGKRYRSRVTRLNARIEGVSQQLEVEGRFEGNTDGLLPGTVGTVEFLGRGARQ